LILFHQNFDTRKKQFKNPNNLYKLVVSIIEVHRILLKTAKIKLSCHLN